MVKFLSYSKKKKKGKLAQITTSCYSLSLAATHCLSLSLDVPLVFLFINHRIFVMFVNKEVCEVVLIISSSTDYEFSAAIFIFKALMWSVYYYHEMFVGIERQENYKRLVTYGFHSWQINWYLTPRREKLLMKTLIAPRLRAVCSWFSFDSSSN